MSNPKGELFIVATPIGNLDDMSPRAISVLKHADCVLAEDTRHSQRLLHHFAIGARCESLHDFNERNKAEQLCKRMVAGEKIALVSDAGTPLVSDPGYHLVNLAHQEGVRVTPVPGPCAAIAALSAAGLPSDHFVFEGFLPAKSSGRKKRLMLLVKETRTLIFYESPHRIVESLRDMVEVLGEQREVTIAREVTKQFETIRKTQLGELLAWVLADDNQQRGEIVLIVAGSPESSPENEVQLSVDAVLKVLLTELPLKQAASLASKITGENRNAVYKQALAMQGDKSED